MKFIKPALIVLAVIFLSYFTFAQLQSNKATKAESAANTEVSISEIPVTVAVVNQQEVAQAINLIGTFEARKELSVIAETQGRIQRMNVEEGQLINKGQQIAAIDDATIQSQLATANASLEKARKDVERYRNLLEVGAISQTQFEDIQLSMQNQETNLTALQQQLRYTRVTAPMSGVVSEVTLEEGSFVNPGSPLVKIVDISQLNMIVMVDERDVVKVKEGQKVNITTEVYPDITFAGVINQISVQADAARKYKISIELPNSKTHPLKAGMYGTALIPVETPQEQLVMTIPRKSVVGSLKQPQVYVLANDTARLTNVEVGETIGDEVVILSGLSLNDQVITTGQINLDNGRRVKVVQ